MALFENHLFPSFSVIPGLSRGFSREGRDPRFPDLKAWILASFTSSVSRGEDDEERVFEQRHRKLRRKTLKHFGEASTQANLVFMSPAKKAL
jgi:hypothetical protein